MAVDDKILKMLAILEDDAATDAEKEAATSRIQHLATVNSIDLERLRFEKDNRSAMAEPTTRGITVGEMGREHKNRFWVDLFLEIARANDLQSTISHDRSRCYAYGYETDIDFAESLFKSLAVQMVQSCDAALKRGDHKAIGVHGRTYRPNFYEAFVYRIGARLREAKREAIAEQKQRDKEIQDRLSAVLISDDDDAPVSAPADVAGTELVLASKREKVNEFYSASTRGKLSRGSYNSYGASTKSYGAQSHGRDAANRASLGSSTSLSGSKKAIR